MLTASRERGVIGCREIDAQHPEDRCQDARGLTQRYVEDETERQGGFDGEIGSLELPAPPADASRCPRGDRVGREPEGDVASPHEGSVVLGPVPDAIRCRVLRMHSRLHIEIMTRRRSRWATCRSLLAYRAESAHQRPPSSARASRRRAGGPTQSRSPHPRTASARQVDRRATVVTRPWHRQRATGSRHLAGRALARTPASSQRDTLSCISEAPSTSSAGSCAGRGNRTSRLTMPADVRVRSHAPKPRHGEAAMLNRGLGIRVIDRGRSSRTR